MYLEVIKEIDMKNNSSRKRVAAKLSGKMKYLGMTNKTDKSAIKEILRVPSFPTIELSGWLKGRTLWNHDDWAALLVELGTKGFGDLTSSQAGRERIGKYLEVNRCICS